MGLQQFLPWGLALKRIIIIIMTWIHEALGGLKKRKLYPVVAVILFLNVHIICYFRAMVSPGDRYFTAIFQWEHRRTNDFSLAIQFINGNWGLNLRSSGLQLWALSLSKSTLISSSPVKEVMGMAEGALTEVLSMFHTLRRGSIH